MNNFDFKIGNKFYPMIKVTTRGLAFNSATKSALNNPKYISVGIDKANKKLAVVPKDKSELFIQCYPFANDKTDSPSIYAIQIRNEILNLVGVDPPKGKTMKFYAESIEDNMLVFDLNEYFF